MQKMMKIHNSGHVAAETWIEGERGLLAYAVRPDPTFTALDGSKDYSHLSPDLDGEPWDEQRFDAHLRARRQAAGVTWEATLAAHAARFPYEADAEAQAAARSTFP